MKRKMLALLLALTMLFAAAYADALPLAAAPVDLAPLERYASWTEDENGWRVYANETAAALAQLGTEQSGSTGYFYLELEGDRATGLIQPTLVFCYTGYAGYTPVNADTAVLLIDNARYIFKTAYERVQIGRATVEVMRAPLDSWGVKAMRALLAARTVRVRLLGDASYTFTPELRDTYASTRQQIEGSSLKGVSAMLAELDRLGVDRYDLWDLNAARWQRLYGFEPAMEYRAMGREPEGASITLNNDFEILARDDNGQAVRALQNLLVEKGYMQGRPDGSFGDGTVRAVRTARRYWGMMECGVADRALIDALTSGELTETEKPEEEALVPFGSVCAARVDRCWFADAFSSEKGDVRRAANADNTLFVAEGKVLNTGAEELTFYRQLSATLSYGDIAFPCTLVCETDAGARFDTSLLPLGEARLMIYAEIPARVAGESGWTLTVSAGGTDLAFEVE